MTTNRRWRVWSATSLAASVATTTFTAVTNTARVALLLLSLGVYTLLRGDTDRLFALIGSKSAVAEAEEEIAAVETAFEAERKR